MPTSESNQKYQIEAALMDFADQPLADAAIALFEVLGYKSKKRLKLSPNMDVNKLILSRIFDTTDSLDAPLFQRPYVWNQNRNWDPFSCR
jgi:hypothetical protein